MNKCCRCLKEEGASTAVVAIGSQQMSPCKTTDGADHTFTTNDDVACSEVGVCKNCMHLLYQEVCQKEYKEVKGRVIFWMVVICIGAGVFFLHHTAFGQSVLHGDLKAIKPIWFLIFIISTLAAVFSLLWALPLTILDAVSRKKLAMKANTGSSVPSEKVISCIEASVEKLLVLLMENRWDAVRARENSSIIERSGLKLPRLRSEKDRAWYLHAATSSQPNKTQPTESASLVTSKSSARLVSLATCPTLQECHKKIPDDWKHCLSENAPPFDEDAAFSISPGDQCK